MVKPLKIENYPFLSETPTAVALGFFDGVHLAHREIIKGAVSAESRGLTPTVFTFKTLAKKAPSGELTTEKEKAEIFAALGVKQLIKADFESVKNLSPEEFVRDVLADSLKAKKVFCGYNYRFGKNAEGDIFSLAHLCQKLDIEVFVTEEMTEKGEKISSTEIKSLLSEGFPKKAERLLCDKYSFEGRVIHGAKLGRKLGTPTLNIEIDERKFLPRFGVYAAEVFIEGKKHSAVLNLGKKPTVKGDEKVTLEAYLLEVSGDFYGDFAKVRLVEFLRDEKKFESLEALKAAIENDISKARELLKQK
ncbi:MAG: bifunctional riboflavin kinase/FAD synthetase [Oscillospiraceae bacterium]|nr:bifunctional riboflavin kinase/FAD synthetase [Oscillospiraceae bacterium]